MSNSPTEMALLCNDLRAEHQALDALVADLDEPQWSVPTPAAGWSVRDQISHLWFFDQRAVMAMTDPAAFADDLQWLIANGGTAASIAPGRALSGEALLAGWRADREHLLAAASVIDPSARVPWYGPAMAARSFVTARLMETWAHGQDVADAVGVQRPATARLRHVAHIGVRARPFSYLVNGKPLPEQSVYVALTAPDGSLWEWGEPAADRVTRPGARLLPRRHSAAPRRRHSAGGGRPAAEVLRRANGSTSRQAFAGGGGAATGQCPPVSSPAGHRLLISLNSSAAARP